MTPHYPSRQRCIRSVLSVSSTLVLNAVGLTCVASVAPLAQEIQLCRIRI